MPSSVGLQSSEHSVDTSHGFGGVGPSKNEKVHLQKALVFVLLVLSPELFAANCRDKK